MPKHHASNGKGVAQIHKTWRIVRAAVYPTQTVTQRIEDAVCLPLAERLATSLSPTADEERSVVFYGSMLCTFAPVTFQRRNSARMKWQLS
jgi:hypothetical protein